MIALPRLIRLAGLASATVTAGGATGLYYLLRRSLPKTKGTLRVRGANGPVEIVRDRWGVPHIFAHDEHDAIFALGFVHAQDRLFQMDFQRRLASGRLSEMAGEATLGIDRLMRRIGMHRASGLQYGSLPQETRDRLKAYAAGVNALMRSTEGRLPPEFVILRYRPESWSAVDSILIAKWIGWTLAGNWDSEIARSRLVEKLGAQVVAELEPHYPVGAPVTVPPGASNRRSDDLLLEEYRQLTSLAPSGGGSNNWAVDGEKSVTGKPLLASDPHLPAQLPIIWYEAHIQGGGIDVTGATLTGIPGVAIGHNRRIAWGMTASMGDQQDLFIERLNPENRRQYEFEGRWLDAEVAVENITIRGRPTPVREEVLTTHHGPVISPAIEGESRVLSLCSIPLQWPTLVEAGHLVMKAQGWEDFREAVQVWPSPGLNFVYADVDGNIGYQLVGHYPRRKKGLGAVPAPGWTGEYDWDGLIPFEELPSTYNPDTHFVASANNKVTEDGEPHIGFDWADGYRVQRITELLQKKGKLSVADFQGMQGDVYSLHGREVAGFLTGLQPEDTQSRRALDYVRAWDRRLSEDSVGGAILEAFFYRMYVNTFAARVGDAIDTFIGKGIHGLAPITTFGPRVGSNLVRLLQEQPADWFPGSDGRRDTWQSVGLRSLREAIEELRRRLGPDISRWQWGRLHTITFEHPLAKVGPLRRLFSRGPYPLAGDMNTVAAAPFDPMQPWAAGPAIVSYRQIVDLANLNNSVSIHATGQSGHPASRHFADFIGPWRRVEYHPMLFDRETIMADAAAGGGILTLEPEG